MATAANYTVVESSVRVQPVVLADGSTAASARFVVTPDPGAKAPNLDVMVVYDDESHRAWWTYQRTQAVTADAELARPWVVARSSDKKSLAGFVLVRTRLAVHSSSTAADSISSARTLAVEGLSRSQEAIESGTDEQVREVNLAGSLPSDFFYESRNASPVSKARIQRVTATAGGWQVDIGGTNAQSARILLAPDFRLVSVTTSPSAPPR